jgi:hypothetical protein
MYMYNIINKVFGTEYELRTLIIFCSLFLMQLSLLSCQCCSYFLHTRYEAGNSQPTQSLYKTGEFIMA